MHFASGFLKIHLLWRTMNGYRKISPLMRDMTTSYYLERMCFNLRFYNFWRIFIEEFQKIWSLSLSIEHGEIFAKSAGKLMKNNQLIKRISKIVVLNWFKSCRSLVLSKIFWKFAYLHYYRDRSRSRTAYQFYIIWLSETFVQYWFISYLTLKYLCSRLSVSNFLND